MKKAKSTSCNPDREEEADSLRKGKIERCQMQGCL